MHLPVEFLTDFGAVGDFLVDIVAEGKAFVRKVLQIAPIKSQCCSRMKGQKLRTHRIRQYYLGLNQRNLVGPS